MTTDPNLAQYEDQFKEIDSKLDAIRSSFQDDTTPSAPSTKTSPPVVGATIILENDDHANSDDDNSTLDGSLSLHVGKLQADLAQQSAAEMERIVQTLPRPAATTHSPSKDAVTTRKEVQPNVSGSAVTVPSSPPSPSHSLPGWMMLLVVLPTLLCSVLAYQLFVATSSPPEVVVSTPLAAEAVQRRTSSSTIQQTYTRQICRTLPDGQQYCESDQESSSSATHVNDDASSSSTGGSGAGQRQVHYYQRQQCQYINGERYCESYEESASVGHDND